MSKDNSKLFRKLAEIDASDEKASKRRRIRSTSASQAQAKATKSQLNLNHVLMEARIILQKGVQSVQENGKFDTLSIGNLSKSVLRKLVHSRKIMMDNMLKTSDDGSQDDCETQNSLQKDYERCRSKWKVILNKRQEDLMLSSGMSALNNRKFQVIDQGLWGQIDSTLAHEKIIRDASSTNDDMNDLKFDDSKVYQHMVSKTNSSIFVLVTLMIQSV